MTTFVPALSRAAEVIGVIMLTLIAGVNLVEVPVRMADDWELNVEEIKKRITCKTKMLLINSPNNPAGYVLDEKHLRKIADLAKEWGL